MHGDHLRDEFRVVGEIGIHDDDEVARRELEPVDVCCAETKLACAGLEEDMRCVGFDELVGYDLGAIWAAVVDDDEFPVEVPAQGAVSLFLCLYLNANKGWDERGTYCSVKVRLSNQVMIGRLRRSL